MGRLESRRYDEEMLRCSEAASLRPDILPAAGGGKAAGDVTAGGGKAASAKPAGDCASCEDTGEDLPLWAADTLLDAEFQPVEFSRRSFVKGAGIAAAAVALSGVSALGLSGCDDDEEGPAVLTVADEDLLNFADLEELEGDGLYHVDGYYRLPAGSMFWMASANTAIMTLLGDSAKPLTKLALLNVNTGKYSILLPKALGLDDGFEIYETRASAQVVAWVECNYFTADWRLYAAQLLDGGVLGLPVLFDEGNADYDPPWLNVVSDHVLWQLLPTEGGPYTYDNSLLKSRAVGSTDTRVICSSPGRLITIPERNGDLITVVPRGNYSSVYYKLQALNPYTGDVIAETLLPQSMKVMNAAYLNSRFAFSVEASYNYENAISKMGTYYDLGGGRWFRLPKTPACPPAMCGKRLLVKSGRGIACVDTEAGNYFNLPALDRCLDHGEYLASSGQVDKVVSYCTVTDKDDATKRSTVLRVFSLLL